MCVLQSLNDDQRVMCWIYVTAAAVLMDILESTTAGAANNTTLL